MVNSFFVLYCTPTDTLPVGNLVQKKYFLTIFVA